MPVPLSPIARALLESAIGAEACTCGPGPAEACSRCPDPGKPTLPPEEQARAIFEDYMSAAAEGFANIAQHVLPPEVRAAAYFAPGGLSFVSRTEWPVTIRYPGPLECWFIQAQRRGHFKPRFS